MTRLTCSGTPPWYINTVPGGGKLRVALQDAENTRAANTTCRINMGRGIDASVKRGPLRFLRHQSGLHCVPSRPMWPKMHRTTDCTGKETNPPFKPLQGVRPCLSWCSVGARGERRASRDAEHNVWHPRPWRFGQARRGATGEVEECKTLASECVLNNDPQSLARGGRYGAADGGW